MSSIIDIINQSLLQIGAQAQVSSISPSDGSTEADAASILYTPKCQAVLRGAHWNCAKKQATLSLLKAARGTPENPQGNGPVPPAPWLYSYAYPPDCLQARYLVPDFSTDTINPPLTTGGTLAVTSFPPGSYAIYYAVALDTDRNNNPVRVILTNLCQAQLVYTADISQNPNLWDPHLEQAVSAYLGVWLVNALARNRGLYQDQTKLATDLIMQARVSDGDESITSVNRDADWIKARGTNPWADTAMVYGGWGGVGFPSGLVV